MDWKAVLKTMGHAAAGAAAVAVMPHVPVLISLIPNPLAQAMVGSALSSIISALFPPPNAPSPAPPPVQLPPAA